MSLPASAATTSRAPIWPTARCSCGWRPCAWRASAAPATIPRPSPRPNCSRRSIMRICGSTRRTPTWPDRDRFVLSKGHAAIGLYPILADLGYYPASELDNFTTPRQSLRRSSEHEEHPGHRLLFGLARSRPVDRRRHGAGGAGAEAQLPRLLHAGRRRAGRRSDLGSGDGRQPLQAAGSGRHRRPQPALHRRPDRGGHGRRADSTSASPLSAGRRSASTATISTPSSARWASWRRPGPASRS